MPNVSPRALPAYQVRFDQAITELRRKRRVGEYSKIVIQDDNVIMEVATRYIVEFLELRRAYHDHRQFN